MAESSESTETGGSRIGRLVERVKPGKGALHVMGVLLLVAGALSLVAAIAYGIVASRTAYFEQRNLRELDRVAAELTATRDSLGEAAALHFVPQQLHFSLSRQLECLVATTEIVGARQRPVTITYYFTDPAGSRRIAEWYAAEATRLPDAGSATPPALAGRPLPDDICSFQRPRGQALDVRVTLDSSAVHVERTAQLTNLLWAMTPRSLPGNLASCSERQDGPAGGGAAAPADIRAFIRRCFELAAIEDMRDQTYSGRDPDQFRQVISQSLDAALRSNTVRINVSTPVEALDLDAALEMFDAVQIIGHEPNAPDRPRLLYQAGRVPAAIEGEDLDEARLIGTLLGVGAPGGRTGEGSGSGAAQRPQQQDFLLDSRVVRTSDLVLFQKSVPQLAGLDCSPCRIVGIVDRAKFNGIVRRIDGVHATTFLIGVLTLIGLIPLLQLKLRRRLDATGQAGQYVLWFSLTLLAASATVCALAIWSSAASRSAGARYSRLAATEIRDAFREELGASLGLITGIDRVLKGTESVFPAPLTLPNPDLHPTSDAVQAMAVLESSFRPGSRAPLIDTVSHFRGDGFIDRDTPRLAATRFPAFGTTIANRSYFLRAKNCEYDGGGGGGGGHRFLLDRVFARPDGAPRVVWLLPVKQPCAGEAADSRQAPAPAAPAAPPPARQGGTGGGGGSREQFFYDPTRQAFLVASGTLRTFLGAALAPGFEYAVIDPRRPAREANVLFHSRAGAELVERFQNEIDNPDEFAAAVEEVMTPHGDEGHEAHGPEEQPAAMSRLDTNYRGRPSRLTVSRLHPDMDWMLVIIEDRNDAGFSIWRAATFGYGIWLVAVLILGLVLFLFHRRGSGPLDRRPGLGLWPARRFAQVTPPRIERHEHMLEQIQAAAALRDRHIWWVLVAAVAAVAAAEGAARIFAAFAAAVTVLAARAYFRGLTSPNQEAARGYDRFLVMAAAVLLGLAVLLFVFAIVDEFQFHASARTSPAVLWAMTIVRIGLFLAACLLLARQLLAAFRYTRPTAPPQEAERRPVRRDLAWMAALLILGGLPAAAGFLDSHDYDDRLVAERETHLAARGREARQQAVDTIGLTRIAALPPRFVEEMVDEPVGPPSRFRGAASGEHCLALSCLAMDYANLREQVIEFSDFAPFRMRDTLGVRIDWARLFGLGILLALPFLALWLAFAVFRGQFFRPPPLLSPGKDPDFDPPLSFDRTTFVQDALIRAAEGGEPDLPFTPPGGNLHLILGADLDLLDDHAPDGRRLRDHPGIQWVDLLEPVKEEPKTATKPGPEGKAIVIGNLDLALQIADPAVIKRTYEQIKAIAGGRRSADRHVFLLADIDPLDRLSMLWERQGGEEADRLVEGWRWAELIQDFTLFPIQRGPPVPDVPTDSRVLRAIHEELSVLDTSFARDLRTQLLERLQGAEAARGRDDEERIISFISEQMSDHYHKLWASSSEEERVILFRIAGDCHLKMDDSRALRSLLARGLLIRVPEYRLMNRSFARYVMRVGASSEIRESARALGGVDRIWPLIRYPLAAIAGSSVLLLQFVAPTSGSAALGAVPALLAVLPALLGKWFQGRGAAA